MTFHIRSLTSLAAIAVSGLVAMGPSAFAADTPAATPAPAVAAPAAGMTRYMVTRTFPAGALDGLDAAGEAAVNRTNAKFGVRWVYSYANPAKTRTYCIYEAPSRVAVQQAATANKLPVDEIMEIPNVLGAH
jgi:hypothetical protein